MERDRLHQHSPINPVYRTEKNPKRLLAHRDSIFELADSEKNALGFLPHAAYEEAIRKSRLIGMLACAKTGTELVGFVLFGGVFPHARIQQIVVNRSHRGRRIASALLNDVVSQLETRGYMTLKAEVASDLTDARAFYRSNGFAVKRSRPGGQARNRQIILHTRILTTPSLLSTLEPVSPASQISVNLGLPRRGLRPAPLYVIDLNVLFDVTKPQGRPRAALANKLIASAFIHHFRLAVAKEFIVELERNTGNERFDPILQFARQLPRLPRFEESEITPLALQLHKIIFEDPGLPESNTPRAVSDARHLAEASLAHAAAYVTSDGAMLDRRDEIRRDFGIDIADLDEVISLLPVQPSDSQFSGAIHLTNTDISFRPAAMHEIRDYVSSEGISRPLRDEFLPTEVDLVIRHCRGVFEGNELVAVAVCLAPMNINASARILIHVRSDNVEADTIADYLLDDCCRQVAAGGPLIIELANIPGQTTVYQLATFRGFLPTDDADRLIKAAIGRPVTEANWISAVRQLRQKSSIRLPSRLPNNDAPNGAVRIGAADGKELTVSLDVLEDALAPTLIIWPGREGVIVPIECKYADDLLGTGNQLPLLGKPQAALLARRTYFNTRRASKLMRPGKPILFYESRRSKGRGAVIASARIVDTTVLSKEQVSKDLYRRAVIHDLSALSSSPDVLATTFDTLMVLPNPVTLTELRDLGVVGPANLQTATAVAHAPLSKIIELGWS